jgi:hypothetical protein
MARLNETEASHSNETRARETTIIKFDRAFASKLQTGQKPDANS